MARPGRPPKYTEKLADTICDRIANGEAVKEICRDKNMPVASTVFRWLVEQDGFSDRYARAKEAQIEAEMDKIIAIADNPDPDADVQRDKLRIDTRKWVASKLKAKKYGDKLAIGGDENAAPIRIETTVAPVNSADTV